MNLGSNIQAMRELRGMTITELADRADVSPQIINALEKRNSKKSNYLGQIAKALGVNASALLDGTCILEKYGEGLSGPGPDMRSQLVPLLDKVPAGHWREAMERHAVDAEDWFACPASCSSATYALRVSGISMLPEYEPNDLLFCDPEADVVHNSDVIVRLPNGDVTFKRLVVDDGVKMIKPLNPDWPGPKLMLLEEGAVIAAVVIGRFQSKRKA